MKLFTLILSSILLVSNLLFADFPIRSAGGRDIDQKIVYNELDGEYLIVWNQLIAFGEDNYINGPVFCQRFGEDGKEKSPAVQVVTYASKPGVAYNSQLNEYLVVYVSGGNIYGQKLSAAGNLIDNAKLLMQNSINPELVYNELANEYLLIGFTKTPTWDEPYSRRININAVPIDIPVLISNHIDSTYSIAYAPIVTPNTPSGLYLFSQQPKTLVMLDSKGERVEVNGSYYLEFDYGYPDGEFLDDSHIDVAFGYGGGNIPGYTGTIPNSTINGPVFMVVWSDGDNKYPWPQRDWTDDYPGVWGGFMKIDPSTGIPSYIDNSTCPLLDLKLIHWGYAGLYPKWKPKVAYNDIAQKFIIAWSEWPTNASSNDATVRHIRATSEFPNTSTSSFANVIMSRTNGDEEPTEPVIATSSNSPTALVIWQDERNMSSNDLDLYGNIFQSTAAEILMLDSPNGGDIWNAGTSRYITWHSNNYSGNIKIEYSTDKGATYKVIENSVSNSGSYEWTVPDTPSDQCLVRISDPADGDPMDESDGVFEITPASGTLTITSPNGGESWQAGSIRHITWKSTAFTDPVKIEYSKDGGTTYNVIEQSITNNGSYPWKIPGISSADCLIRISDATDGAPMDVSDDVFTINLSSITIQSPNGGEKWETGSWHDINFTTDNVIKNKDIKIEYSTDNGKNYKLIATIPSMGTNTSYTYPWEIPIDQSNNCLVRVSMNILGASVSDVSDDVFEIIGNIYEGDLLIETQNDVDNFNYTEITGDLTIEEKSAGAIQNLNGLNSLKTIGGSLFVINNSSIVTLNGLLNISYINADLYIISNDNLINIDGLYNTSFIGGNVRIIWNKSLNNIEGFSGISSLYGYLYILDNDALKNLTGLTNISSIGDYITIDHNKSLANLNGLLNVKFIEGDLNLWGNDILENLNGISNLSNLSGNLSIKNNTNLTEFCSLYTLFSSGFNNKTEILGNAINPTPQEILNNGPCTNTPTGLNIILALTSKVQIKFANVTQEGTTDLVINNYGEQLPSGYAALPKNDPDYYSITTTASFSGDIEITIDYDDSGLSSSYEKKLQLRVFENSQWMDITTSLNADSNKITGTVDHLSDFVIMYPTILNDNVVKNTSDSGPSSFRNAINYANTYPGPDTIYFALPVTDPNYVSGKGYFQIFPLSPLPAITDDETFIAGSSKDGPEVEINGKRIADETEGIIIESSNNIIRGLAVNNFNGAGIIIEFLRDNNHLYNNYIGIDPTGTEIRPNKGAGILIIDGRSHIIGSMHSDSANVICGNEGPGIMITQRDSKDNRILTNYIGTDKTRTKDIGNNGDGILIDLGARNNVIRGNPYSQGTVIHNNGGAGIRIKGQTSSNNAILKGSITNNEGDGILLENGANNNVQAPVITEADSEHVAGQAEANNYIQIYEDENDEGGNFIGSVYADETGKFEWFGKIEGPFVTATASDTVKNFALPSSTSQFSIPFEIVKIIDGDNLIVTTTADSGKGSLREAINLANNNIGPDSIHFKIPLSDPGYNAATGTWTITTENNLPEITDSELIIDGGSQTKSFGNTNTEGPEIILTGNLNNRRCLYAIDVSGVEIYDLIINRYGTGIDFTETRDGIISGCYIGTNFDGTDSISNNTGISLSRNTSNILIEKNIISGSNNIEIMISDTSSNNIIRNNIIGLDRRGINRITISRMGINIQRQSGNNQILNNRIGGSKNGILMYQSNNNLIENNSIGSDENWEDNFGCEYNGVHLWGGSSKNIISKNIIGNNGSKGIYIIGEGTIYNTITENLISSNNLNAILLENGGNESISSPVINSFNNRRISGISEKGYFIEVFTDEEDEGHIFIGSSLADQNGNFIFEIPDTTILLNRITATATDSSGNTSEFSDPIDIITKVEETNSAVPVSFKLYQNYPNPFNPITTIRYGLPHESQVNISIYNVLGERLREMVNAWKKAGYHEFQFNGIGVPSGVYLYRIEAISENGRRFSKTKKLILMK